MTTTITTATVRCAEVDCARPVQARGLCHMHYKAAHRRQTLPPRIERNPIAAFWDRVEKTDTCWWWRGGISMYGYGQFQPARSKNLRAHKFAWEMEHGPTPDDMVLDHLCRNRACVRPEHLEPVTPRTNTLRGIGPAAINSRKTACVNGHRFTPENTRVDAQGNRSCWMCLRAKFSRILARQKAERAAVMCGGPGRNGPCSRTTTRPTGRCFSHSEAPDAD